MDSCDRSELMAEEDLHSSVQRDEESSSFPGGMDGNFSDLSAFLQGEDTGNLRRWTTFRDLTSLATQTEVAACNLRRYATYPDLASSRREPLVVRRCVSDPLQVTCREEIRDNATDSVPDNRAEATTSSEDLASTCEEPSSGVEDMVEGATAAREDESIIDPEVRLLVSDLLQVVCRQDATTDTFAGEEAEASTTSAREEPPLPKASGVEDVEEELTAAEEDGTTIDPEVRRCVNDLLQAVCRERAARKRRRIRWARILTEERLIPARPTFIRRLRGLCRWCCCCCCGSQD